MPTNNPQSADRFYKFAYKLLGIRFHRYFYHEGEKIEFIETEIAQSGQRKDIVVKVDEKTIHLTEFMAKGVYDEKLYSLCDYHEYTRYDSQYNGFEVKSSVISIANPNHGKNKMKIDENITFGIEIIFIKLKNGRKVLNNLIYNIITNNELSDMQAIDLIILPDMDIDMPIKQLMKLICHLIAKANIPDKDFKKKLILCEIKVLARFFKEKELLEMIELLKTLTKNSEVERIVEKYGQGFDSIYFDGKADGIVESKLEIARNFLRDGFDVDVVVRNTGLSLNEIKSLKEEL